MTKFWTTYRILMIFLLVSLVMPLNQLKAQENKKDSHRDETAYYEEQLLMNLETSQAYDFDEGFNRRDVSNGYNQTDPSTFQGSENYIQLQMEGSGNKATAIQLKGRGNAMDLAVKGHNNEALYWQEGNNNIIMDEIIGNNLYREINQYGDEFWIYNQGMQSVPMIINQRGQGMKITITGPPLMY